MSINRVDGNTGALIIVFVIQNFKTQVISLLRRNGAQVSNNATTSQIAIIISNLLKISRSFNSEFRAFLNSPEVVNAFANLGNSFTGDEATYFRADGVNAKYFRADGVEADYFRADGYYNNTGDSPNIADIVKNALDSNGIKTTPATTPTKPTTPAPTTTGSSKWMDLLNKGLDVFTTYNTNQANSSIANAQRDIAQAGFNPSGSTDTNNNNNTNPKDTPDTNKGMSTTTIVLLSLLGISAVGAIVYFVMKKK